MKYIKLKILFSLLLFLPCALFAGTLGKGAAEIFNGNESSARQQAIRNAQRDAIEKGVGLILDSKTVTENWRVLQDEIYTSAQGFVTKYEIVGDKKSDDGSRWEVVIDAEVAQANLKNKLQNLRILHKRMGNKRFMVVYLANQEEALEKDHPAVLKAKDEIQQEFNKSGFRLFNSSIDTQEFQKKKSIEALIEAAKSRNIEIIIQFEVIGNNRFSGQRSSHFTSAKSKVRLGVYDVISGRQISNVQKEKKHITSAKVSSYEWGVALAKAASNAAKDTAFEAIQNIVDYYKTVGDIGNSFFISLKNYTEDEQDEILTVLENLDNFQSMKELEVRNGYIAVEYFSNLSKSRLRRKLRNEASKKGIKLKTDESVGNRLVFTKPGTS